MLSDLVKKNKTQIGITQTDQTDQKTNMVIYDCVRRNWKPFLPGTAFLDFYDGISSKCFEMEVKCFELACLPLPTYHHPLTTTHLPPPTYHHPLTTIHLPLPTYHRLLTTAYLPPPTYHRLLTIAYLSLPTPTSSTPPLSTPLRAVPRGYSVGDCTFGFFFAFCNIL